jgi:hypothetical protein
MTRLKDETLSIRTSADIKQLLRLLLIVSAALSLQ